MNIEVARSAGFCFGVKRALKIALATAQKEDHVCMLGDIVHNETVVKEIEKAGIQKITRLGQGTDKVLLIRAHGCSRSLLRKARERGYSIVDATCPMVKEIHTIVRAMEQKTYDSIVIGDKRHDEVQGIIGQINGKAIVIDPSEAIPIKKLNGIKKACVVVQSTQNRDTVLRILSLIKKLITDVKFFNTICQPTRIKQEEIKRLPLTNDVMIIIGSKMSANTKRLFEISKGLNKRTHWIQSATEIRSVWFKGVKKVGITSGASTPYETTQEVITHIKNLIPSNKTVAKRLYPQKRYYP